MLPFLFPDSYYLVFVNLLLDTPVDICVTNKMLRLIELVNISAEIQWIKGIC